MNKASPRIIPIRVRTTPVVLHRFTQGSCTAVQVVKKGVLVEVLEVSLEVLI